MSSIHEDDVVTSHDVWLSRRFNDRCLSCKRIDTVKG